MKHNFKTYVREFRNEIIRQHKKVKFQLSTGVEEVKDFQQLVTFFRVVGQRD